MIQVDDIPINDHLLLEKLQAGYHEINDPKNRKRYIKWLSFISRYESQSFRACSVLAEELAYRFNGYHFLASQSLLEFQLSKKLLQVFLDNQNYEFPYSNEEIRDALVLSIVTGKYYHFTRCSLDFLANIFSSKHRRTRIIPALKCLFEKYPIPHFFYHTFHLLNDHELHFMIHLMQGIKPKEYAGIHLAKRDWKIFYEFPFQFHSESGILFQVILQVKIFRVCRNVAMSKALSQTSHEIGCGYGTVLPGIEFWKNFTRLMMRIENEIEEGYSHYVDYYLHDCDRLSHHLNNKSSYRRINEEIEQWHMRLAYDESENNYWKHQGMVPNQTMNHKGVNYSFRQLTSSFEIYKEGRLMKHCVSNYTNSALEGENQIWSVSARDKGSMSKTLTLLISNQRIVEAAGKANRKLTEEEIELVNTWCEKNKVEWTYFS